MRKCLVFVVPLLCLAACSPEVRDQSALAVQLTTQYGATNTTWVTHGATTRLELRLTDRRWRGLNTVVPDSARVIAKFALAQLDEANRPDSIMVAIQTVNRGFLFFRETGSTGMAYATNEL